MLIEILFRVAQATTTAPTPPAPAQGSATQLIIAALASAGLGAIIASVVTGLFSKKKLGAEAAEIITKAAAGVVTNLQDEMARMKTNFEEQLAKSEADRLAQKAEHDAKMEDVRLVLQLHVAWDALAISKLAEIGIEMPEPPPLLPPRLSSGGLSEVKVPSEDGHS